MRTDDQTHTNNVNNNNLYSYLIERRHTFDINNES